MVIVYVNRFNFFNLSKLKHSIQKYQSYSSRDSKNSKYGLNLVSLWRDQLSAAGFLFNISRHLKTIIVTFPIPKISKFTNLYLSYKWTIGYNSDTFHLQIFFTVFHKFTKKFSALHKKWFATCILCDTKKKKYKEYKMKENNIHTNYQFKFKLLAWWSKDFSRILQRLEHQEYQSKYQTDDAYEGGS